MLNEAIEQKKRDIIQDMLELPKDDLLHVLEVINMIINGEIGAVHDEG